MKVHLSKVADDGLTFDLEISPLQGWFYPPLYKTNILWANQQQYLMSFSYKWASGGRTHYLDLRDSTTYPKERNNDKELTEALFKLWQHAEWAMAYNGDNFDLKWAKTFFVRHGLVPKKIRSIDPLKICRKEFNFASNTMSNVARELKTSEKMQVQLLNLSRRIIEDDDQKAWKIFKQYNIQDTNTLFDIWEVVKPYASTHINMAIYSDAIDACPRCQFVGLREYGYSYGNTYVTKRYYCPIKEGGCGYTPSGRVSIDKPKPKFK